MHTCLYACLPVRLPASIRATMHAAQPVIPHGITPGTRAEQAPLPAPPAAPAASPRPPLPGLQWSVACPNGQKWAKNVTGAAAATQVVRVGQGLDIDPYVPAPGITAEMT